MKLFAPYSIMAKMVVIYNIDNRTVTSQQLAGNGLSLDCCCYCYCKVGKVGRVVVVYMVGLQFALARQLAC